MCDEEHLHNDYTHTEFMVPLISRSVFIGFIRRESNFEKACFSREICSVNQDAVIDQKRLDRFKPQNNAVVTLSLP